MSVFRLSVCSSALLLLLSAAPVAASPAGKKVDRALRAAVDSGRASTQNVIITVNPGCRAAVRSALERHGDVPTSEHEIIDALAGQIHTRDVDELAKSPCVRAISEDADVFASAAPVGKQNGHAKFDGGAPLPALAPTQALASTLRDTLGLPHVADGSAPTGGSIGVAVIDSGIAPSDDFGSRITGFFDFTHGGRATVPYDDFGHGTHISGLIASSGVLSNYEFQGVAPNARLVGLKVLDRTGAGKTSSVIKAIEFVIANRARLNVQVINLSLGHPIYAPAADDPLVQAVEKASAAGLVVVASAGNFGQKQSDGTVGYAGITSPGNAPSAITVGAAMTKDTALRHDDAVAPYSSRGPTWFDAYVKPDVVAPGHRLASDANISSYLYGLLDANRGRSKNGQPLLLLSGSSMATAVTSGVVALVLDSRSGLHGNAFRRQQQSLTPNLVKGILEYSAVRIGNADYLTQGAGEVNAAGAIALASAIDTSKAVGVKWLITNVVPFSSIGGANEPWSRHVLYGNRALSGGLLNANNIVWSTNIVWGTALAGEGDNIVWGTVVDVENDNIVWGTAAGGEGDNIVWGTNIVWSNRVIGQRIIGNNIVWGGNIVWVAMESDNIVWGTMTEGDNIVWGTATESDNIVWGTGGAL